MRFVSLHLVVFGWSALASIAQAQDRDLSRTEIEARLEKFILQQMRSDFNAAEFYERKGHVDAAVFNYKLVCRRYPDTDYARKAAERIADIEAGNHPQYPERLDRLQMLRYPLPPPPSPAKIDSVPSDHPMSRILKEIAAIREQLKKMAPRLAALEAKSNPARVGEIIIVGNTDTPDEDIRKLITIYPGELLHYPRLRQIAQNLAKSGLFVVDVQSDARPTVCALDAAGPFKDILVKVQEFPTKTMTFSKDALDQVPPGWKATQTGQGQGSVWKVVADPTAPSKTGFALAQTAAGPAKLFNLCILESEKVKDVRIRVHFKAIKGEMDQGGGIVWRYQDAKNYYVARMNPLEDNYRVYKVIDGKRIQLETATVTIKARTWHEITIQHVGKKITCALDGNKLLDAEDDTIAAAGQTGLWTKADAQTYFDLFAVSDLGGKK